MNNPMIAVDTLDRIINELRDAGSLSLSEKAALYSLARLMKSDLLDYLEERGGYGYANEKVSNAVYHIAAITGFDITNGHDDDAHRSWAMGEAGTLRGLIKEVIDADPDR